MSAAHSRTWGPILNVTVDIETKPYTAYVAVKWIQMSERRMDQGRTTRNSVT